MCGSVPIVGENPFHVNLLICSVTKVKVHEELRKIDLMQMNPVVIYNINEEFRVIYFQQVMVIFLVL